MEKESKNLLFSFIYLLCFYLAIQLLPLSSWIASEYGYRLVKLALLLVVAFLITFEKIKAKVICPKKEKRLPYLFLVPLVLGPLSNFLYGLSFNETISINIFPLNFSIDVFITLVSVYLEEMLFRLFLLVFFLKIQKGSHKELLAILYSALTFSLMHCVNFYGNSPISILIQLAYTLVLGLILGFVAIYFESPILPIIGHFLFNFLNQNLFNVFYNFDYDSQYLIFSVVLGVILLLYCLILSLLSRRKESHAS